MLGELQKEMSLERAESIVDRVGEGVAAQRVSPALSPLESLYRVDEPVLTDLFCLRIENR